ncbi:hypothetical protein A2U01_0116745, partial [Trifolium medium]|nr:hypothetical protein [Trifolium medium]
ARRAANWRAAPPPETNSKPAVQPAPCAMTACAPRRDQKQTSFLHQFIQFKGNSQQSPPCL